jgi:integrase
VPWVFCNPRTGQPYVDRKKTMKRLCEKAEIPYFRFHALRHSGASVMENANIPVGSIQRILGRENRKTTEIYLHRLGESERRAVEIYEKVRGISHTDSHTGFVRCAFAILFTDSTLSPFLL